MGKNVLREWKKKKLIREDESFDSVFCFKCSAAIGAYL